MSTIQELRIKRKLAHAAAKHVRQLSRSPVTDRVRSVARNEARKANLEFAFEAGRNLYEVETTPIAETGPFSNHSRSRYDQYLDRVFSVLVLDCGYDPDEVDQWISNG